MIIDCEKLLDLRRNAYVECSNLFIEKNNVLGIFGDGIFNSINTNIPLAEIYACGLVPIPIEGIDSAIFEFGDEKDFCDVIRSTLIYLKTDKCPLLFSSRMFVVTNSCYDFLYAIKNTSEKKVFSFDVTKKNLNDQKTQIERLILELCDVYQVSFSDDLKIKAEKKLNYIESVLQKLENYSNLKTEELFLLRYFTPYMTNLDERVKLFENLETQINFASEKKSRRVLRALCPRGNYKSILKHFGGDDVMIKRAFSKCEIGYEKCILSKGTLKYGY